MTVKEQIAKAAVIAIEARRVAQASAQLRKDFNIVVGDEGHSMRTASVDSLVDDIVQYLGQLRLHQSPQAPHVNRLRTLMLGETVLGSDWALANAVGTVEIYRHQLGVADPHTILGTRPTRQHEREHYDAVVDEVYGCAYDLNANPPSLQTVTVELATGASNDFGVA